MQRKIRMLAALVTLLGGAAMMTPRNAEAATFGGCTGYTITEIESLPWCTGFEGCTLLRGSCSNETHTQSCVWEC